MDTTTSSYPPPVDKLLTYGKCQYAAPDNWPNYLELGLGPEHIPDLIRMATDKELHEADSNSLEVWAPAHAWRTLGQLRAEAAIEPLLPMFEELRDDDWAMKELPEVYSMIGPAAIPAITAHLADKSQTDHARIIATNCLVEIGTMHPEARTECVAALTRQLELFDENDPEFNGFLIDALVELEAVEAAPLMKQAFDAERVDTIVAGDWEEAQVWLGLKPPEEIPQGRLYDLLGPGVRTTPRAAPDQEMVFSGHSPSQTSHRNVTAHKKTKNKMAKQSRKKNRKR